MTFSGEVPRELGGRWAGVLLGLSLKKGVGWRTEEKLVACGPERVPPWGTAENVPTGFMVR